MTVGHILTIDLSPFQSSIHKNIKFNENSLSQMTFVNFNINYETFVKIHETSNKIYKILHMMINVVSPLC
jgi:hypothetical protein